MSISAVFHSVPDAPISENSTPGTSNHRPAIDRIEGPTLDPQSGASHRRGSGIKFSLSLLCILSASASFAQLDTTVIRPRAPLSKPQVLLSKANLKQADLVVSRLEVQCTRIGVDVYTVVASYTVKNIGGLTAPLDQVGVQGFIATEAGYGKGPVGGYSYQGASGFTLNNPPGSVLPPGGERSGTLTVNIALKAKQRYVYLFLADYHKLLGEADETNNQQAIFFIPD